MPEKKLSDLLRVQGNTLTFRNKTYRCAIGKGGFAGDKKEGDGCTPTGTFPLRECWYRADRLPTPQTALPLRIITAQDGWCDDPESVEYNKHIIKPSPSGRATLKPPLPLGEGWGEGYYHYPEPQLTENARQLRHLSTTPEQKLWQVVRNRQMQGYKFRRQHPIPPYVADFCCEERKVIVELDGDSHFSEQGIANDAKRTAYLEQQGYHIVRFSNQEIMANVEGVYRALTLALSQRERELAPRHENLWRDDAVYDLIIPLGYNDNPVIPGKGSAILMHIARPDYSGTEGCVALGREDLLEILPHLSITSQIQILEH